MIKGNIMIHANERHMYDIVAMRSIVRCNNQMIFRLCGFTGSVERSGLVNLSY